VRIDLPLGWLTAAGKRPYLPGDQLTDALATKIRMHDRAMSAVVHPSQQPIPFDNSTDRRVLVLPRPYLLIKQHPKLVDVHSCAASSEESVPSKTISAQRRRKYSISFAALPFPLSQLN
jgi:hypothetical protein